VFGASYSRQTGLPGRKLSTQPAFAHPQTKTQYKCLIKLTDSHSYQNINFEPCALFMFINFLRALLLHKQIKSPVPSSTSHMGSKNSKQAKQHHPASRQPPASGCKPPNCIQQQYPFLNHSTINNKTSNRVTREASKSYAISSTTIPQRLKPGLGDPWVCCWDMCGGQNPASRTWCRKCTKERSKLRKRCPIGQCSIYGGHVKGKYQILDRSRNQDELKLK
jgi:hypothetical protein